MTMARITKTHNKRYMLNTTTTTKKRNKQKSVHWSKNELMRKEWLFDVRYCVCVCVSVGSSVCRYMWQFVDIWLRVFCLRFEQCVQNYMHTPRNTNWRCTRATFIPRNPLYLSLWLRMNAFWSISLCVYTVHCTFVLVLYICDVAHAIPNPIVRVQRNTSMLVCFRICMYVRMHISIDSIPSNINNNNNNNSYTNKNNNTLKKSHPHRNSCTATIHQMNVKCNGNRSKVLRALSPAMCEYICNVYMHGWETK